MKNSNQTVPLSVVVITKNEERNLPDCLESVKWAKEIIVVDDESSDKTVEIAKKYTRQVLKRKMDLEGRHRNFAYAQATNDWILSLDADERVSPGLALELEKTVTQNDPAFSGHSIPIKTFIGKRWIRRAGYYPANKLRLFRKGKFRYEEANVHPRAFLDGKESPLKSDILHFGYRSFTHFIDKLNNQTTLEAEKWIEDKRRISSGKTLYKSIDRFCRHYLMKKGCEDGFMGFIMSVCHALYQLFTYAKYQELKNAKC